MLANTPQAVQGKEPAVYNAKIIQETKSIKY